MQSIPCVLSIVSFATAALVAGCNFSLGESTPAGSGGASSSSPTDCGQTAACPLSQACLAIADNHGSPQFGLRIAELTMSNPVVFAPQGILGSYLEECISPSLPACFPDESALNSGTTSWLLSFDLGQETLTIGGAAPPADPKQGYTLLDTMVSEGGATYAVAPVTFDLVTAEDGSLGVTAAQDVVLPMFFPGNEGSAPTGPVALPMHDLTATSIVVSASHDCVGRFDPAIFEPSELCTPATAGELFFHAGHLDAYVSLEEADTIDMGALGSTLCVVLSGNVAQFGDGAMPVTHCARTNGVIDFKGDWCAATNSPATGLCADAVQFTADFAASAVTLH